MKAAAIENRYIIVKSHNDEINFADQRILGLSVWQFAEFGEG